MGSEIDSAYFDDALAALQTMVEQCPDSEYAADAQDLIAELQGRQNDHL